MAKPSIPKGMRDFGPEEMLKRTYIFDTIRSVFEKYGYAPLETPTMEKLSVLTGKYGDEGDRLIFKVLNSGDFLRKAKDLDDATKLSFQISEKGLRYDLTVPFARYVVMNQHELTFPFKRYQVQPVWRADRPQKGRYREFYQCDSDVVGSDSLLYDAEFLAVYDEALARLGFEHIRILLSNRKVLTGFAEAAGRPDKFTDICVAIDKLDKVGEGGVRKELADRGLQAGEADTLFELITFEGSNEAKLDFLAQRFEGSAKGQQGVAEMREVLALHQQMDTFGAKVEFDLKLARGLNYYTGSIYEVKVEGVDIGSIGGGGRYDDLTGVFGMPGMSGVGISFGADRIYLAMESLGLFREVKQHPVEVLIINFGTEAQAAALGALRQLRRADIPAELYPEAAKLKKQFGYADKKNVPYTLIIGTEEIASGTYQLKHMKSGEQQNLTMAEVLSKLTADP